MASVPYRAKTSATALFERLFSADRNRPLGALIEISDHCNEVCVHCYQVQGQKGEMTTEQVKRVLDDLAAMGVLFLTISGGEATLRPDLLEILAHARARKFSVKLYTNGLRIGRELAHSLAELAVQEVQISLYSHRPHMHDWVTRVPGSWAKTVAAIRHLRAEGVAVVVKTPLMSVNETDTEAYRDFVQSLGVDYMFDASTLHSREDGYRGTQSFSASAAAKQQMWNDPTFTSHPLSTAQVAPRDERLGKSVCGACSTTVHIEANGEIRPCTMLNVACGNAVKEGVQAAWHDDPNMKAIRSLTWADLHGCRDCDLQPYCSRCFAEALLENGQAMGPYESACQQAKQRFEVVHGQAPAFESGQDLRVGPYRQCAEAGKFGREPQVLTERDAAFAHQFPWTRAKPGGKASDPGARPGDLVQIRRPGSKELRPERVPPLEKA